MKAVTKKILQALDRQILEGRVHRIDIDRVDVAPVGSSGCCADLP